MILCLQQVRMTEEPTEEEDRTDKEELLPFWRTCRSPPSPECPAWPLHSTSTQDHRTSHSTSQHDVSYLSLSDCSCFNNEIAHQLPVVLPVIPIPRLVVIVVLIISWPCIKPCYRPQVQLVAENATALAWALTLLVPAGIGNLTRVTAHYSLQNTP